MNELVAYTSHKNWYNLGLLQGDFCHVAIYGMTMELITITSGPRKSILQLNERGDVINLIYVSQDDLAPTRSHGWTNIRSLAGGACCARIELDKIMRLTSSLDHQWAYMLRITGELLALHSQPAFIIKTEHPVISISRGLVLTEQSLHILRDGVLSDAISIPPEVDFREIYLLRDSAVVRSPEELYLVNSDNQLESQHIVEVNIDDIVSYGLKGLLTEQGQLWRRYEVDNQLRLVAKNIISADVDTMDRYIDANRVLHLECTDRSPIGIGVPCDAIQLSN